MKATRAEQQAIIAMLSRIYEEIREVEQRWDIRIDDSDFRPRIEYFHDAVRALTLNDGEGSDRGGRLAVELLAYDIGMLRYIQGDPLSHYGSRRLSVKKDIMHSVPRTMDDTSGLKPDPRVKHQLIELYKSYAVLFAALFSHPAERNYQSRMLDGNAEVEDMAGFIQIVEGQSVETLDMSALADGRVITGDVMNKMLIAFKSGKLGKRMQKKEALKALKEMAKEIDREKNAIEQAHFAFATAQLAIYEGSRDVVKKMAVRGLNIVGDFVENAIRDAKRSSRGM